MEFLSIVEASGHNRREIAPDHIRIDIRFCFRTPTRHEIVDLDSSVESDFNRIVVEAGIDTERVSLEEYAMRSASSNEDGRYDCYETIRHYRCEMPIELDPVVKLARLLAESLHPSAFEVHYFLKKVSYEIDCLEADALRNARHRADILADVMFFHLGVHTEITCQDAPAEAAHLIYEMRTPEDLYLLTPALLTLPHGTFPLTFSLSARFHSYRR